MPYDANLESMLVSVPATAGFKIKPAIDGGVGEVYAVQAELPVRIKSATVTTTTTMIQIRFALPINTSLTLN